MKPQQRRRNMPRTLPAMRAGALAVAMLFAAPAAWPGPVNPVVVAGQAQVSNPSPASTVILQNTARTIINWDTFNIGAGQSVQFIQPNGASVALNRVQTGGASAIAGQLSANGKVFLINPSGVLFSSTAVVNVGALVASALDISDSDFLAGKYTFTGFGDYTAQVANQGSISAADRGTVALLGGQVSNTGTITAKLGTIGLASANKVTLDFAGDGLTRISVDEGTFNSIVSNGSGGKLVADGGMVVLKASDVQALTATVVRQDGIVQARSLVERGGQILLEGGVSTVRTGAVEVTGSIDASGVDTGLAGGQISVIGKNIHLGVAARIDASGNAGGGRVTVGGVSAGNESTQQFGLDTFAMDSSAAIHADSTGTGTGGTIQATADNFYLRGILSARGGPAAGGGGMVVTEAYSNAISGNGGVTDFTGLRVDTSAPTGAAGYWEVRGWKINVDAGFAEAVGHALDTGSNVFFNTAFSTQVAPGAIVFSANIEKRAGGDAALEAAAAGNVEVVPGVSIASVADAGRLAIALRAGDYDASGGSVVLGAGSALRSNGGTISLSGRNSSSGNSNFVAEGARIDGATVDSRPAHSNADVGVIDITGSGAAAVSSGSEGGSGVYIRSSTISSGAGAITIDGTLGASATPPTTSGSNRGVLIDLDNGASITAGTGAVSLNGYGGLWTRIGANASIGNSAGTVSLTGARIIEAGPGVKIDLDHGALTSGGAMIIDGTGGVAIDASQSLWSAGGNMSITSQGGGARIAVSGTKFESQNGNMTLSGDDGGGIALSVLDASMRAPNGSISFNGRSSGAANGVGIGLSQALMEAGVGGIGITGAAAGESSGVSVSINQGSMQTAGGLNVAGTASGGYGLTMSMSSAAMSAGAGGIVLKGSAAGGWHGLTSSMNGASIQSGGNISVVGNAVDGGYGIYSAMHNASISAASGGLAIKGTASGNGGGFGASLSLYDAAIGAAAGPVDISGTAAHGTGLDIYGSGAALTAGAGSLSLTGQAGGGGEGGASGLSLYLRRATLGATGGNLLLSGAGAGNADGLFVSMVDTVISSTRGNVRIAGLAGAGGSYGSLLTSDDGESGNGAQASGGVVTGSTARITADHGNIDISGVSGSAADASYGETPGLAGTRLSGIEVRAVEGAVKLTGVALAAGSRHDSGLWLQDSVVATSAGAEGQASTSIAVLGAAQRGAPGLTLDGVSLGDAGQTGDIVIGARSPAGTSMIAYQVDSEYANAVRSRGAVNLRPDDQGLNIGGSAATSVPISVGGSAAFNVSPASLGLSGSGASTLVVGSAEHTGAITWNHATPWGGNLTLQNDGAGSAGISLNSALNAEGTITLSSGGAVDGAGGAISAPRLLLHGAQPQSNFQLTRADNQVGAIAAIFDQPKSPAAPEYGDVNFASAVAVSLVPLSGAGFSSLSTSARGIAAGDSVVAGDLLVRAGGDLILGQNVHTLGSDITLVSSALFLNSGNHTLTPGGDGNWRVFADTWVGEQRGALQPSTPLPNRYNCVFGQACGNVAGNHFIYRQQPLLTLQADPQNRLYGDANPTFTFSSAGLVNGDTIADAASGVYATAATSASNAGSYAITGSFVSPAGYALSALPGTLQVARAPLAIVADDKSKIYGGAEPLLTASYSGFRNGDGLSSISPVSLSTVTGKAADAGLHPITVGGGSSSNYDVSYIPGTLTVTPAALLISADDKGKVYGAAEPLLTAGYSGFQYDDGAGVVQGLRLSTATGAAAGAGVHAIDASGAGAANYLVSYRAGALTVTPAPLMITANDQTKMYGAADPLLTASYSGLQYADSAAAVQGLRLSTATGAAANAGVHAIDASGAGAANYAITYRAGALTVAKAPLLITANDQRKVYGAAEPALTASYSGLQYADSAADIQGLRLQTVSGAAAVAGTHSIGAGSASAANYDLSYRAGMLTVAQAPLTVAANDAGARYGDPTPALSARYEGLVYGETPAVVTGLSVAAPSYVPAASVAGGDYAIVASGASAANYRIAYLPGTLHVTAMPFSAVELRPVIARDVTFESSYVYEKNVGTPRMCVGTGPLGASGGAAGADLLGLEWSRVRVSPNLSNCLALGQRNSCSDF